ncbi:MAG: sulfatase-like hydrolase/transferase [Thermomicrobiales bacterium]
MKRRDLLQATAALPIAAAADKVSESEAKKKPKPKPKRDFAGMNVILFITDQQRKIMHFPKGWARRNLPGATRLQDHGLTFENAFTNACMCSPARATLFSGYFPAQHGVKYTLEENMSPPKNPQVALPLDLPNLATVMKAAGYHVPYKGKWHLSKMLGSEWEPEDVNQYGFERWNPPDAGANQDLDQFGGGDANNDGRFMEDHGDVEDGHEGVIEYLKSEAAKQQPFFMVVSLVNPHDVLSYPRTYETGGYDEDDLEGRIGVPETVNEDLSSKPTAQRAFLALSDAGLGVLNTEQKKLDYLNFYGNLMKESDAYLVQILDTLEHEKLLQNTLIIQTSDHGEMGLTHGGQRQKNFNFYEETLRVPLTYSNPRLYPTAETSDALVSHVDFLPTMASLFNVPREARADWEGVDYSAILHDPKRKGVQDYTVFTYDDFQAGQPNKPYVPEPNHIVSLREDRYKLAKYYAPLGPEPDQWEMYDLKHDPLEVRNIAAPDAKRTKTQKRELARLQAKLADIEEKRLQPLSQ